MSEKLIQEFYRIGHQIKKLRNTLRKDSKPVYRPYYKKFSNLYSKLSYIANEIFDILNRDKNFLSCPQMYVLSIIYMENPRKHALREILIDRMYRISKNNKAFLEVANKISNLNKDIILKPLSKYFDSEPYLLFSLRYFADYLLDKKLNLDGILEKGKKFSVSLADKYGRNYRECLDKVHLNEIYQKIYTCRIFSEINLDIQFGRYPIAYTSWIGKTKFIVSMPLDSEILNVVRLLHELGHILSRVSNVKSYSIFDEYFTNLYSLKLIRQLFSDNFCYELIFMQTLLKSFREIFHKVEVERKLLNGIIDVEKFKEVYKGRDRKKSLMFILIYPGRSLGYLLSYQLLFETLELVYYN